MYMHLGLCMYIHTYPYVTHPTMYMYIIQCAHMYNVCIYMYMYVHIQYIVNVPYCTCTCVFSHALLPTCISISSLYEYS